MSDVTELIAEARANDVRVPGVTTMIGALANALEAEHAEVERLTECLEAMNDSADILDSKNARLTAQLQAVQEASDDHMQKLAHRVMDVFGNADEDALAEEIMQDVFAAIGLTEAFGAAILDAATDEHSNHEFCDTRLGCVLGATDGSK